MTDVQFWIIVAILSIHTFVLVFMARVVFRLRRMALSAPPRRTVSDGKNKDPMGLLD